MSMEVSVIRSAKELERVEPFRVEYLLWGTKKIPDTYGYLGFVPGEGFYLKMVCEEADPLRTYTNALDPVYRDSALEAFFEFEAAKERIVPPIYLNFEVNANGALLAAYGTRRTYRTYFAKEEMDSFDCKAQIDADKWSMSLHIPIGILEKIYGPLELKVGSEFTCNFYKISEAKEMEHYASCFPILSEIPSFHMPEFFGTAKIVDSQKR